MRRLKGIATVLAVAAAYAAMVGMFVLLAKSF